MNAFHSFARIAIASTVLAFAGCAHTTPDDDLRMATGPHLGLLEIGEPPSQESVMAAARSELELKLKDAESARYKFAYVARGYVGGPRDAVYGWVGVVMVNAKNSYGAYAGFEPRYIFFGADKPHDITELVNQRKAGVI